MIIKINKYYSIYYNYIENLEKNFKNIIQVIIDKNLKIHKVGKQNGLLKKRII